MCGGHLRAPSFAKPPAGITTNPSVPTEDTGQNSAHSSEIRLLLTHTRNKLIRKKPATTNKNFNHFAI